MFADNGKISGRQTFRLYVFDLMGIATLLLPPYLAGICGVDGIWAICIGSFLGFVYLFYLNRIMKKMNSDLMTYLKREKGSFVRGLTEALVGFHSIFTAGFLSYVFTELMKHSLVQEASFEWILLVIVVMAAYAVSGGIECRARVYEVLFWLVLIPYVAMVLASVRNFKVRYAEAVFSTNLPELGKGIYGVFLLVTPLFFSLFLLGEKGREYGSMGKSVARALGLSAVMLLGSYVLLVGNFGAKSLATMDFPIVTLMSTVQFEGNFLKRMDAFMVAVWFFTLFAVLNLHMHYGVTMCKEVKGLKKSKLFCVVLPAILVYGVAYAFRHVSGALNIFLGYYSYVAAPLMVVGPALLLLGRKKISGFILMGVMAFLLGGCSGTELEERCFPLLVVADYDTNGQAVTFCAGFPRAANTGGSTGMTTELQVSTVFAENFEKSKSGYEENLNKNADYNHLKVLVLGEKLLAHPDAYNQMLDYLAKTEEFPRNTYVCVVTDTEALLRIDAELPQDLGTYLEEYLYNHEKRKNRMLTLGDLLDEKENNLLVLYAPYLIPEDSYVRFGGYCTIGEEKIYFYEMDE